MNYKVDDYWSNKTLDELKEIWPREEKFDHEYIKIENTTPDALLKTINSIKEKYGQSIPLTIEDNTIYFDVHRAETDEEWESRIRFKQKLASNNNRISIEGLINKGYKIYRNGEEIS